MAKILSEKKTLAGVGTGSGVALVLTIIFLASVGEGTVVWQFSENFIQDSPTHFHIIGNITLKDYQGTISLDTEDMSVTDSDSLIRSPTARRIDYSDKEIDVYGLVKKSFRCDYSVSDSLLAKKQCIKTIETPNGTIEVIHFGKEYKSYDPKTQTFLYDKKEKTGTTTIQESSLSSGLKTLSSGETIAVRYDIDVPFGSSGKANLTVCFYVDGERICSVLDPYWNSTVYAHAIPFTFMAYRNTTNVTLKVTANLTSEYSLGYVNLNASSIAFGSATSSYDFFNYYWDDASGGYNNLTQDAENATFYVQIPQVNGSPAGLTNTFYLYLNNQSAAFDYSTGDVFWMNDSFEDGDWTTGVNWYYAERIGSYVTEGVSSVPYDGSLAFSMEGINVYGWGVLGYWFNDTNTGGHGKDYPYSSITVESAILRTASQKTRHDIWSSNYTKVSGGQGRYWDYHENDNITRSSESSINTDYSISFYPGISTIFSSFVQTNKWYRHKTTLSSDGWAYVEAECLINSTIKSLENSSFNLDTGKPLSYTNHVIFFQGGSHAIQEGISYYDSIFAYHDLPNVSIAQGNIESTDETPVLTWAWGRNITSSVYNFNITINSDEALLACNLYVDGYGNLSMDQNTTTQWYYNVDDDANNNYSLRAYCNDTANNTGFSSLAWYEVDTDAPLISWGAWNGKNITTRANYTTISWTTNEKVENCTLNFNGTWYQNNTAGTSFSKAFNNLHNGNYSTILTRCEDDAGNVNQSSTVWWNVVWSSAGNADWNWTDRNTNINVDYTTPCVNTTSSMNCTLTFNGTAYSNATTGTDICWALSGLNEGNYSTITAKCSNSTDDVFATSSWVNVDTVAPVLTWNWARNRTATDTRINVTVETDEQVIACNLDLNGTNVSMSSNSTTQFVYEWIITNQGNYTLQAYCNDTVNNTGVSTSSWYVLDTIAPVVSWGAWYGINTTTRANETTITWTTNERAQNCSLNFNGTWTQNNTVGTSFSKYISKQENGNYSTILVRCADDVDNVGQSTDAWWDINWYELTDVVWNWTDVNSSITVGDTTPQVDLAYDGYLSCILYFNGTEFTMSNSSDRTYSYPLVDLFTGNFTNIWVNCSNGTNTINSTIASLEVSRPNIDINVDYSYGISRVYYIASAYTQNNLTPVNQTASKGVYNITNSGSEALSSIWVRTNITINDCFTQYLSNISSLSTSDRVEVFAYWTRIPYTLAVGSSSGMWASLYLYYCPGMFDDWSIQFKGG